MEREARAKALEQSRVEEEERKRKAIEEEEQRQRQLLLLQEQKRLLQEQELQLQQAGTSASGPTITVHESIQVPVKRKRGRKKIVREPVVSDLIPATDNLEEQKQSQVQYNESKVDSSAVADAVVAKNNLNLIQNSSVDATEIEVVVVGVDSCTPQSSSSIHVHDKDAIAKMENDPVKDTHELRFLSDISRDKWIGTIVYFDDKGDMVNHFFIFKMIFALQM